MRDGNDQQRVAVRSGFGGEIGADHAAGAAAIIDEDLLAEFFAELVGDDAPDHVVAAARRERNDQANGPCRIILRDSGGRKPHRRQQEPDRARSIRNLVWSAHESLLFDRASYQLWRWR